MRPRSIVAGDGIDVHEDGPGADLEDDVARRHPRERRRDHLVARADARDPQGDLHRAGAGIEGADGASAEDTRESFASNAFTCGPEVIQPERSTSATPAIVASSIVGRVKGRKGSAGFTGRWAAAGEGMCGGHPCGPGSESSRLVAEKIMARGGRQDVDMKRGIREEVPGVADPRHGEHPAGPGPLAAELGVIDEARARSAGLEELELQLVPGSRRGPPSSRVVGEVVEESVVVVDAVARAERGRAPPARGPSCSGASMSGVANGKDTERERPASPSWRRPPRGPARFRASNAERARAPPRRPGSPPGS